jgi:hypothetical protein
MDQFDADDLDHAADEGFPDPIADALEGVVIQLNDIARKQRQLAKWRYKNQRRAIADGRWPQRQRHPEFDPAA